MDVRKLVEITGADFFTGVPDSQLRALCDYLMDVYGTDPQHHVIAANEGNCAALAAGYYFATGKTPVIYMQNSGQGNSINPIASLLHEKVYAVPSIFIIGWRGETGVPDEPQHLYQGEITLKLLEVMGISACVIGKDTTETMIGKKMEEYQDLLAQGKGVAFVIRKGGLFYDQKVIYKNEYTLRREEIIECILETSKQDPVIATTGKTSRELFEIRERNSQGHQYDFLTVGSMGHASSIALGVALHNPDTKIWCLDGDGAALMHMGAMAVIAQAAPKNLVHVVINNGAHESVGGMPTAAKDLDLYRVAESCGYQKSYLVTDKRELEKTLNLVKEAQGLTFIEVKAMTGAREDLGRPTTTPLENKRAFMQYLAQIKQKKESEI